jgi:hypothetical protein
MNLASAYSFSFTTGSTLDTTPPSIVGFVPRNDAVDVDPEVTIRITFDETMDLSSVDNGISFSPSAEYSSNWDSTGKILSLQMDLEGETEYSMTISGSARDLAGNQLGGSESFSFTTGEKEVVKGESFDTMPSLLILVAIILLILIILFLVKGRKNLEGEN